ncbi:hypothetical protein [Rhodopseudomonas sp. BR0G17]|uniref:hypothetical protein n=1 Tax=Rhodopseudomonas sp. BR0G17 TaxID=2269368 RepID=UPI0013DF3EF0|nr:hypothetical protein [Rhodopseudomonas sp. BR0G17]NEW96909.1 hypothetical protein [Rhodopseudomonas sp. BR0G17]
MANLQANVNGHLTGSFMIPDGVPTGVRRVEYFGSGGSRGFSQYTAYGWRTFLQKERLTVSNLQYIWVNFDPLAQTFILNEARQVVGVDVKFTAVGNPAHRSVLQIRRVELGIPTAEVVAEASVDMHGVAIVDPLSGARTEAQWTKFNFARPVTLAANQAYAIVLMTDDPNHAVAVADLGGFDQVGGWITQHAFMGGTLLSSVDARSWQEHPARSLCFRMRGAKYAPTAKTVALPAVPVTNATDLLPLLLSDQPEGTTIELELVGPDGFVYRTGANSGVELPASITGNVTPRIKLSGTAKLSPLLAPVMQIVAGELKSPGDYVSRAFSAGTDARIVVIADVYLPGAATLSVKAQTGVASGAPVWSAMTISNATPLGDGWVENEYVLSPLNIAETRVKLELAGGPSARPFVRNLRAVVTPVT